MKCPHCPETKLLLSDRQGIEIDYCPDCRGIWLDRGELDKILERSRRDEPAPPQDSYRGESHEHPKYHKRKKSFLEELFD